jgi:hypothetical protein
LLLHSSYLPLGVPNGLVIHHAQGLPVAIIAISRLLTHHSGGDHGGVEDLRQGFPSPAGYREELLDPPDLATAMVAACSMFREKEIRPLGFSRRGELIGERASSEVGPPSLTIGRRRQGLGHAPWW